ncbi:MAG TPA: DUF2339 domain-containing protein [Dehalococcoidales bacterium]
MKCPNCLRENQPSNQFCIFCGARLLPFSSESQEPPAQSLEEEVQRLRASVRQINERLTVLEQRQGIEAIPLPVEPIRPQGERRQPPVQVEPVRPPVEHWQPPVIGIAPSAPREAKPPRPPGEWEQILGGNWLARIGVLALLFGVGFFLKYAFDRNWILPVIRILLGVVAGLIMLGGGYLWRKKYPVMTQALTGGGIGIMYLSIFAAFAAYQLIPLVLAVILLLIVCAISVLMALRYNSMSLALLGIIGAFLGPLILGVTGSNTPGANGTATGYWALVYILVVDLGVLATSTFRNWRWFTLFGLVCSLIFFGVWYGSYGYSTGIAPIEISLTILFLIFVGATSLFHIVWKRRPQGFDYSLMVLNATSYATISASLLWDDYRSWMGAFFFLLSLFFAGLAYIAFKRTNDRLLSQFALGIAIVLFTTSIPVQFGDVVWTTGTWAAQAAVLIWLSLVTKSRFFRVSAYISFGLVAIRLLFFDSWLGNVLGIDVYRPVFNDRMLAFMVGIIAVYIASYLIRRYKEEQWQIEHAVFFVAGNIFTLWLIGIELVDYLNIANPTVGANLSLLFLLALAVVTILNQLVWRRDPLTKVDLALLFVNAIIISIFSAFLWGQLQDWMGCLFLTLALCHGVLATYFIRKQTGNPMFVDCALGISVVLLTAAIPIQFGDKMWTTIVWSVEGALLVWLSFFKDTRILRWFAYGIFATTAIRLLFFDTPVQISSFKPLLNERLLAFLFGIAGLYLAGYLMVKAKNKLDEQEGRVTIPIFFIAANFFTLWLFSAEILNAFDRALYNLSTTDSIGSLGTSLRNFQNLSITGLWAFYAVIALVIGIVNRIRFLRLGALALLLIAIGKVFVYDVFTLAMVYRIVAFIGLGLLLLASGYLYQRYSKRIREFLTKE